MGLTIYDIAREAGVSIATVSRVFNNSPRVAPHTRKRVLEVARRLGYQPHVSAQSLARRQAQTVAAIVPMLTNYFFVEVLRGLQDRLAETNFDLLVYAAPTLSDVDAHLERALQRGRSAGVMIFSTPMSPERVERLQRSRQPVVLVDSFHPDFDSVSIDNEQGGYLAARHLLEHGYRRIGLLMAHPDSVPARERRHGYERALREAGLEPDPDLIVASTDPHNHGYTEEGGYEAMKQLLERTPRPEAVFVVSDIMALGALRAVEEAGLRVPDDLGLIGFDDLRVSRFLGLSTLRQPMYEMGKLAAEKLLRRIAELELPVTSTVFAPRLICRRTCAPGARDGQPETAALSQNQT
ncbi:LacI family DNA-binding transcriptional regulator [Rhodothermus marinus]|jgi:LacI family transcriptional regulator|uniref:Transcriptional regulator, LacI family n=1 Tax=Rhodothermus marinus (strain ATCC 43812 / DSM 4252 / R-10) TaxID=518766 RepID=D0MDJ2_RHOM4|nr:LacI family DNA-binding transcriptional regulator [Rhodothermus marinus]ACY47185.1 transcriptional regulator, LacI family [Rhodothermus marinus DSM 4252]AEN72209.1 transcriptional regulator, LacI family [Rhodothermus marinus SG0.5JP17-172]